MCAECCGCLFMLFEHIEALGVHLGHHTTPVWDDGYFGPIRCNSDDVMSRISALTNQNCEQ